MDALRALGQSLRDLLRPKILMIILLPPVIAFIVWGGLGYLYWESIFSLARSYSDRFLFSGDIPPWILDSLKLDPANVAVTIAATVALLFLIPLALVTSMALTSLIAMPVIVKIIGKEIPLLEKKSQTGMSYIVKNIFVSICIYLVLWVVTLPLWVIPGLGIALPLIINGYLNYRLLVFDALGAYASSAEIEALVGEHRRDFLLLGMVLSIPLLTGIAFLIMPVYSGLVFSRYSLLKLNSYRKHQQGL